MRRAPRAGLAAAFWWVGRAARAWYAAWERVGWRP